MKRFYPRSVRARCENRYWFVPRAVDKFSQGYHRPAPPTSKVDYVSSGDLALNWRPRGYIPTRERDIEHFCHTDRIYRISLS